MKQVPEYQASKIRPIVQLAARLLMHNPSLTMDHLWAELCLSVPELKQKDKCAGCNRNMKIAIYEADLHDALLLLAMANQVHYNILNGTKFTEANKVHLPTLNVPHATLKRQTKCDYLGLIKQPENWRGTGNWLLTRWAWKALRGEPIPKTVKYWQGQFLGRGEAKTTLVEIFDRHSKMLEKPMTKKGLVKRSDYRSQFEDYKPEDWKEFLEIPTQGELM